MRSGVRPLKRFGQHFLKGRSVAERIVESMDIGEGDCVLEIGPGEGVLTEFLMDSAAERVIGVEIDRRLADWLRERFGQNERFELVEGDFLQLDLSTLVRRGKKVRVVGNLPYSITTPILFRVLDHRAWVKDLTVTVQKEVGERIASPPGSKAYGVPSVLFQVFSQVEVLFFIPRKAFYPVPKVDSSVLRFRFFDRPLHEIEDVTFFRDLVKTVFGQRRKMLRNTLKKIVKDEKILETVSADLFQRPEELSVSQFVRLSNELVQSSDRRTRGRSPASKK